MTNLMKIPLASDPVRPHSEGMTNSMLAPEMLAHVTVAPALKVGDLAVFETYTRNTIGCSISRMWAAGEISTTAQIEVKVIGDQAATAMA
jgi:hypothetical protein